MERWREATKFEGTDQAVWVRHKTFLTRSWTPLGSWKVLRILRLMQTDPMFIVGQQHPTLLGPTMLGLVASVCMEPQQCWHLLAFVAYSLKPVKLLGPCKRTQHCWPTTRNNVGSWWPLLRPFAWAFTIVVYTYYLSLTFLCFISPQVDMSQVKHR